jgi:hypothetical protein
LYGTSRESRAESRVSGPNRESDRAARSARWRLLRGRSLAADWHRRVPVRPGRERVDRARAPARWELWAHRPKRPALRSRARRSPWRFQTASGTGAERRNVDAGPRVDQRQALVDDGAADGRAVCRRQNLEEIVVGDRHPVNQEVRVQTRRIGALASVGAGPTFPLGKAKHERSRGIQVFSIAGQNIGTRKGLEFGRDLGGNRSRVRPWISKLPDWHHGAGQGREVAGPS